MVDDWVDGELDFVLLTIPLIGRLGSLTIPLVLMVLSYGGRAKYKAKSAHVMSQEMSHFSNQVSRKLDWIVLGWVKVDGL